MEELAARLAALEAENASIKMKLKAKEPTGSNLNMSSAIYLRKECKLPTFSGQGKSMPAGDFLIEMSDAIDDPTLSDKDKVNILKTQIQGEAYIDLCNKMTRDEMKDPVKILKAFKELFCKTESVEELMRSLWSCAQGSSESITDYLRKILSTHRRIRNMDPANAVSDSVLKMIFLKGVNNQTLRLQLETLAANPDVSLDKLRDFSVAYEKEYGSVHTNVVTQAQTAKVSSQKEDMTIQLMNKLEKSFDQLGRDVKELLAANTITNNNKSCYACGRTGHFSRNCWLKRRNNNYHQQHIGPQEERREESNRVNNRTYRNSGNGHVNEHSDQPRFGDYGGALRAEAPSFRRADRQQGNF